MLTAFDETESAFTDAVRGALARMDATAAGYDDRAGAVARLANELDWLSLAAADGPGLAQEFVLLGALFEELGAIAAPLAILPNVLAAQAARLSGTSDMAEPRTAFAGILAGTQAGPPHARTRYEEWPVAATKALILIESTDAGSAWWIAVGMDHPQLRRVTESALDGSVVSCFTLDQPWDLEPHEAPAGLPTKVELLGRLLRAAALLGAARTMQDLALAHIRTRKQFGHPIGSFQAARHLAVDADICTNAARLAVYEALWRSGNNPAAGRRRAAASAVFAAAEAAQATSHAASQLHGGIGYMLEHGLPRHFLYVRAQRTRLGTSAQLLDDIARAARDDRAEGRRFRLWDEIG